MNPRDKIAARAAQSQRFGKAVVKATKKAPKAGPPKPGPSMSSYADKAQGPRTTINYKDLPPDEQDQLAKKAGLTPGPGPVPPGVVTPAQQAMAATQPVPAPVPKDAESPSEDASETPDQEAAENQAKSDLEPPEGHHGVVAHVRKNPVVSKHGAEKLRRRGVPIK